MRARVAALVLATTARVASAADETAFERGLARFQADDFAGAIAPLVEAHASDPRDPDTALMLGIAYYRIDRVDDARPLLVQAERDGDAEGKASARVFLGLIADAHGDAARARDYYELVARSPTALAASGHTLLDAGGVERWSIVAIVRPGYDSNVALQPVTATPGMTLADTDLTLVVAATARPSADLALVLDETFSARVQAKLRDYDAVGDVTGATYAIVGAADRGALAYHFEVSALGGLRYELGHVADAAYRHAFGELGVGAHYTFAARSYAQDPYVGYTGTSHTGFADLSWGSAASNELVAGYVIERDATDDPALAAIGNGGHVTLRAQPWAGADFRGSVLAVDRIYDAASMGRRDVQVRADAALYMDLSRVLGVVFGATVVRNASNDAGYDYTKWTVFAGLVLGASSS